jgi:hypothetical protein
MIDLQKKSTCGTKFEHINWHKMKNKIKTIKTFIIISMNVFNKCVCVCVKFIPCNITINQENHLKFCTLENKN